MWRGGSAGLIVWAAVAVLAPAGATRAQPAGEGDAQIEAYLERLGLKGLLAEQWGARIKTASTDERTALSDKLAKLYIELIGAAKAPAEREQWEERAKALVRLLPEAQTTELRLEFAKQSYNRAEEIAERHRLRLADNDARGDAEKSLRALKAQFEQIGGEINRREESLSRGEARPDKAEEQLAEVRRLRAIAFYYAGWSAYYHALLTGQEASSADAIKSFGWLLGRTGGNQPTLDKIPKGFFRYEHICRAAIGVALSQSIRGQDVEAIRWISALEDSEDTPPAIRAQLLSRKVAVLAAARRWADIEREVRNFRSSGSAASPKQPLEAPMARLLAIVTFESDSKIGGPVLEQLRAIAMADLVARGEVANVLDLAQRFGTEPLGEQGFIVHYVRGVQAYERTSNTHRGSGPAPEEPTTDNALINAYREVAGLLIAAIEQPDADRFAGEKGRALLLAGRAYFFAGDLDRAADRFQQASAIAIGDARQDALWLAVVAVDRLATKAATHPSKADERLDELSTLFIRTYPATERAANLLLRRTMAGRVQDDEAVKVLLNVPRESAVYEAARRQAARLLYRLYRSAGPEEKPFAAQRYVAIGEEIFAIDRRRAMDPADADSKGAIERVIVGARQLLDAILGVPGPDLPRAEGIIEVIATVAGYNNTDLSSHQDELNFRRFQILVARDKLTEAGAIAELLLASKDREKARFGISAQRILYNHAVQRFRKAQLMSTSDPVALVSAARDVLRFGLSVIDQINASAESFRDPAIVTLNNTVAQAGADVFKAGGDQEALRAAVRIDKSLVAAVPGHVEALTRLGETAEAAGDQVTAIACWRTLSAGLEPGTPDWFRARYHTIRLLAVADRSAAAEAMQQHILLYPAFGPAPWGDKLRALEKELPAPTAPSQPGTQPAAPGASP